MEDEQKDDGMSGTDLFVYSVAWALFIVFAIGTVWGIS